MPGGRPRKPELTQEEWDAVQAFLVPGAYRRGTRAAVKVVNKIRRVEKLTTLAAQRKARVGRTWLMAQLAKWPQTQGGRKLPAPSEPAAVAANDKARAERVAEWHQEG